MKKFLKNKAGVDVGDLYNFVILLVLVGIALGIGVLVLDKFVASGSVSTAAQTAMNATRDEISGIATNWLSIIVIVVIAALVLGIVIRNLGKTR